MQSKNPLTPIDGRGRRSRYVIVCSCEVLPPSRARDSFHPLLITLSISLDDLFDFLGFVWCEQACARQNMATNTTQNVATTINDRLAAWTPLLKLSDTHPRQNTSGRRERCLLWLLCLTWFAPLDF